MGNRIDGTKGQPELSQASHIKSYGEEGLAQHGNGDAKKLASAYKQLSKDGLSESEIVKLQKLDESLEGASFECLSSHVTLVIQKEKGNETDFVLVGSDIQTKGNLPNTNPAKTR